MLSRAQRLALKAVGVEDVWVDKGHNWIGKRLRRFFGRKKYGADGTIVKWLLLLLLVTLRCSIWCMMTVRVIHRASTQPSTLSIRAQLLNHTHCPSPSHPLLFPSLACAGDEEDLEAHEVKLAMKCFNQKLERSEAKEKGLLFEVAKL